MNIAEKIKSFFNKQSSSKKMPEIGSANKFSGISSRIITKIRKTPYWEEYPEASKEKMISKYFDKKVKTSEYMGIPYNKAEKQTFIKEVLKSVV